jgi:hypothetical protein
MPSRKCVFSDRIKEEFLFIKESCGNSDCSKVLCSLSCAVFSINHGGIADTVQDIRTKKKYIRLLCLQEVAVTGITEKYVCK